MKYDKVVEMNQKIGKHYKDILDFQIHSFTKINLFVKFCMKQFESRISVIKITLLRCVLNKR